MKRKKPDFLSLLITAFICLSLAFPPSTAFALRLPSPAQGSQLSGLEEILSDPYPSSPHGAAIELGKLPQVLSLWYGLAISGELSLNRTQLTVLARRQIQQEDASTVADEVFVRVDARGMRERAFRMEEFRQNLAVPLPEPLDFKERAYQAKVKISLVEYGMNKTNPPTEGLRKAVGEQEYDVASTGSSSAVKTRFLEMTGLSQQALQNSFPFLSADATEEGFVRHLAERENLPPGEVQAAVSVMRDVLQTRREIQFKIYQGVIKLMNEEMAGKLSYASVVNHWGFLSSSAEGWPRLQAIWESAQHHLSLQENVTKEQVLKWMAFLISATIHDECRILAARVPAPMLQKTYFDAKRFDYFDLMGRYASRLKEWGQGAGISHGTLWSIYSLGGEIYNLELEAAIAAEIAKRAEPLEPAVSAHPEDIGLLIMNDSGNVRLVPGGNGYVHPYSLAAAHDPVRLREWLRSQDRIAAVLVPAALPDGFPGFEAWVNFYDRWPYLQHGFPETHFLLATVAPDGTLRFFQPVFRRGKVSEWAKLQWALEDQKARYLQFKNDFDELFHEGPIKEKEVKKSSLGFSAALARRSAAAGWGELGIDTVAKQELGGARGIDTLPRLQAYSYRALLLAGGKVMQHVNKQLGFLKEIPAPPQNVEELAAEAQRRLKVPESRAVALRQAAAGFVVSCLAEGIPADYAAFEKTWKREAAPPKDDLPADEMSVLDLLQAILDPRLLNRPQKRWQEMYESFFRRGMAVEKALEKRKPLTDEERMWHVLIPKLLKEQTHVYSVQAILDASRINTRAEHLTNFLMNAAVASRIYEGVRADNDLGISREALLLDGDLPAPEFLRRFKKHMEAWNQMEAFSIYPYLKAVGFVFEAEYNKLGESAAIAPMALLAAEWAGTDPFINAPIAARALVENGVKEVRLVNPKEAPAPALQVRFEKPLQEPFSKKSLASISMALSTEPVFNPAEPLAVLPDDISEQEFIRLGALWIEKKLACVVMDPAELSKYTFKESDPLGLKLQRLEALLDLVLQGKALIRSGYQPLSPQNAHRNASLLSRTPKERQAAQKAFELAFLMKRLPTRDRVPDAELVQQLREQLAEKKEQALFFARLGVLEPNGKSGDRAEELRKKLTKPKSKVPFQLEEWLSYGGLLGLAFSLELSSATLLLNRLRDYQGLLQDPAVRVSVEQQAESLPEPLRGVWLSELNHALLRRLLAGKNFLPAAEAELVQSNLRVFGEGALQTPTVLQQKKAAGEPVLQEIHSAQNKILKNLEQGTGTDTAAALQKLENAGAAWAQAGIPAGRNEVLVLDLETPGKFKKGIERFSEALRGGAASEAPLRPDPVRLELFRMLAQALEAAGQGNFDKARELSGEALPLLNAAEAGAVGKFQRTLAHRRLGLAMAQEQKNQTAWSAQLSKNQAAAHVARLDSADADDFDQAQKALSPAALEGAFLGPVEAAQVQEARRRLAVRFAERMSDSLPKQLHRIPMLRDPSMAWGRVTAIEQALKTSEQQVREFPEARQAVSGLLEKTRHAGLLLKAIHGMDVLPMENRPLQEVLGNAGAALEPDFKDALNLLPVLWPERLKLARERLARRLRHHLALEIEIGLGHAGVMEEEDAAAYREELLQAAKKGMEVLEGYPPLRLSLETAAAGVQIHQAEGELSALHGSGPIPANLKTKIEEVISLSEGFIQSAVPEEAKSLLDAGTQLLGAIAAHLMEAGEEAAGSGAEFNRAEAGEILQQIDWFTGLVNGTEAETFASDLQEAREGVEARLQAVPEPAAKAPEDLEEAMRKARLNRAAKERERRAIIGNVQSDQWTIRQISEAIHEIPHLWEQTPRPAKDLIDLILTNKQIAKTDSRIRPVRLNADKKWAQVASLPDPATAYPYQAISALMERLQEKGYHPGNGAKSGAEEAQSWQDSLRLASDNAEGNTVFFLHSDLFDTAGLRELDDLMLAHAGIRLRELLGWGGERQLDLQLVVVNAENKARYEELYAGWRVIEIGRSPSSDPRPLPASAVPWAALDALISGEGLFQLDVLHYLHLREWTLPEALDELSLLAAA